MLSKKNQLKKKLYIKKVSIIVVIFQRKGYTAPQKENEKHFIKITHFQDNEKHKFILNLYYFCCYFKLYLAKS